MGFLYHIGSPCFETGKAFHGQKETFEGFPSKPQTRGNTPILSVLLYVYNTDFLTSPPKYLSILNILVKGAVSDSLVNSVKMVLLMITEYRFIREIFVINDTHSKLI